MAGIQNGYSIIDRQDDELVDFAQEREIEFVPFFPLGSAFRGGPARLAGEATIVQVADFELDDGDLAALDRVEPRDGSAE